MLRWSFLAVFCCVSAVHVAFCNSNMHCCDYTCPFFIQYLFVLISFWLQELNTCDISDAMDWHVRLCNIAITALLHNELTHSWRRNVSCDSRLSKPMVGEEFGGRGTRCFHQAPKIVKIDISGKKRGKIDDNQNVFNSYLLNDPFLKTVTSFARCMSPKKVLKTLELAYFTYNLLFSFFFVIKTGTRHIKVAGNTLPTLIVLKSCLAATAMDFPRWFFWWSLIEKPKTTVVPNFPQFFLNPSWSMRFRPIFWNNNKTLHPAGTDTDATRSFNATKDWWTVSWMISLRRLFAVEALVCWGAQCVSLLQGFAELCKSLCMHILYTIIFLYVEDK